MPLARIPTIYLHATMHHLWVIRMSAMSLTGVMGINLNVQETRSYLLLRMVSYHLFVSLIPSRHKYIRVTHCNRACWRGHIQVQALVLSMDESFDYHGDAGFSNTRVASCCLDAWSTTQKGCKNKGDRRSQPRWSSSSPYCTLGQRNFCGKSA